MTVESISDLLAELRRSRLLDPGQAEALSALPSRYPDVATLGDELVRRGWLTPFQLDELRQGRGSNLVLGQYVLLKRLGEGGMGAVFKARHRRLERIDAVKVVRPEYLQRPESLLRFHREARAAARLSHPNIVAIYDADEVDGVHFLAMEYVEGRDLGKAVADGGALTVRQACAFVRQVALGLQHAHERGMVHRDIKPSNLLLTADGATVKILDMGLARLEATEERREAPDDLTATGSVMGTPDFMAPEQALDARSVDIRADIYALGCTLYFLLTGAAPFPTGSLTQKLLWHQRAEPAPLESKRFDLPLGLPAVVRRMMAKKPEDRYATPVEAALALEPFATGAVEERTEPSLASVEASLTDSLRPSASSRSTRRAPNDRTLGAAALDESGPATEITRIESAATLHDKKTPSLLRKPRRVSLTIVLLALGSAGAVIVCAVLLTSAGAWFRWGDAPPIDPRGSQVGLGDEMAAAFGGRVGELRLLRGHEDTVLTVAFSPDGRRAASAGKDRTVRVWDLFKGKEVRRQEGHPGPVMSLAWSRTSDLILTGGVDKTEGELRLWDLESTTADAQRSLTAHGPPVLCTALSPNGQYALAAGGAKGSGDLRLLNLADGTLVHSLKGHTDIVWRAAFSPDGMTAASCGFDRTARVWDLKKGEEIHCLDAFTDRVLCVAFSPDGGRLLTGGEDGLLRLWDVKTWQETGRLVGHRGDVLCAAFTPDGGRIVSGGADGTVRVWDVAGLGQIESFAGHGKPVTAVDVAPGGRRALSGGEDATVRLWGLPK